MAAAWQLVGFIPMALFLAALLAWAMLRHRWTGTRPVHCKLLRTPGHYLQNRLEAIQEKTLAPIIALAVTSTAVGLMVRQLAPHSGDLKNQILIVTWCAGLAIMLPAAWRLVHLILRIDKHSLGLSGERAVGEELNKLMRQGCFVYHDYPGGDNWNIDHIVIAPSGVYAIETKTRRKKKHLSEEAHKVSYDGRELLFPDGRRDRDALNQILRNAANLSDTLSKADAEPIRVHPILIMPGWYIDRKASKPVLVLNHKEISNSVILRNPAVLSSQQMQRLAEKVESRCRDVPF